MNGYVVTRPYSESGLGSNLASMAGALLVAERLGRDLVVDWRQMLFLVDPQRNYYTEYFEALPRLQGVRVHYAPDVDYLQHEDETMEVGPSQYRALIENGNAGLPRYVVLTPYHGLNRISAGQPATDHYRLRAFYRELRLAPETQRRLDEFFDAHHRDTFVVGINLATGNMPPPDGHIYFDRFDTRMFSDEDRFLRRIGFAVRLALRGLPRYLRERSTIFYATDSSWGSELLGRLPRSHTRRTVYPPPGAGRFFSDYASLGYDDVEAARDQVIDHFLLGRGNALVYTASMFSQYAQVSTDYFNGNARNLESLYARWWTGAVRTRARSKLRR